MPFYVDRSGSLFEASPQTPQDLDTLLRQGLAPATEEDKAKHNHAEDVKATAAKGFLDEGGAVDTYTNAALRMTGGLGTVASDEQVTRASSDEARLMAEAHPTANALGRSIPLAPLAAGVGMATGGLGVAGAVAGESAVEGIAQEYDDAWLEQRPMELQKVATNTLMFAGIDGVLRGVGSAARAGLAPSTSIVRRNIVAEAASRAANTTRTASARKTAETVGSWVGGAVGAKVGGPIGAMVGRRAGKRVAQELFPEAAEEAAGEVAPTFMRSEVLSSAPNPGPAARGAAEEAVTVPAPKAAPVAATEAVAGDDLEAQLRASIAAAQARRGAAPEAVGLTPATRRSPRENVVYHGTVEGVTAEQLAPRAGLGWAEDSPAVVYFTDSAKDAKRFAQSASRRSHSEGQAKSAHVIEASVDLKNPKVLDAEGGRYNGKAQDEQIRRAMADGHDGIIYKNLRNFERSKPATTYVVWGAKARTPGTPATTGPEFPKITRSQGAQHFGPNMPKSKKVYGPTEGPDLEAQLQMSVEAVQAHNAGVAVADVLREVSAAGSELTARRARQFLGQKQPSSKGALAAFAVSGKSLETALEDKRQELDQIAADPARLADSLAASTGDLVQTHPSVYQAMVGKVYAIAGYLKGQLPPRTGQTPLNPKGYPPSQDEQIDWAYKFVGATQPELTLRDVARGQAMPKQIDALRANWPEIIQDFQVNVLGAITTAMERGREIPRERVRQIEELMGQPGGLDLTMGVAMAQSFEAAFAQEEAKKQERASKPSGGGNSPSLSTNYQTRLASISAQRNMV